MAKKAAKRKAATKKSAAKKKSTRTTMRSSSGTKLYAKRNAAGQFEDIQTYKRAQGSDIKRTAAGEVASRKKKATKKKATKKK